MTFMCTRAPIAIALVRECEANAESQDMVINTTYLLSEVFQIHVEGAFALASVHACAEFLACNDSLHVNFHSQGATET
jgi:hypothetical protein